MRRVAYYEHHTGKLHKPLTLAVVSDLHNEEYEDIFPLIKGADALLVPGDICDRYRDEWKRGAAFLRDAARQLPTFYSLGNHEFDFTSRSAERVAECGVTLLLDEYACWEELCIGGLRSRSKYRAVPPGRSSIPPRTGWLDEFEKQQGYKILLSHHPEYYESYLRERDIDLILSGHAHGGQIRLFGHGLFSPGQGIWPKYTHGLHDGKFIVSAGLANTVPLLPRLFNPTELVFVDIEKTEKHNPAV